MDKMELLKEFIEELEKNSHEDHKYTESWIFGILNAIGTAGSYSVIQSQVASMVAAIEEADLARQADFGQLQNQIGRQGEPFNDVQNDVQDV